MDQQKFKSIHLRSETCCKHVAYLRDDVGGRGEEEEDDEKEDVYEEGLEEEEAVRVVQVLPIDILDRRGESDCPTVPMMIDSGNRA